MHLVCSGDNGNVAWTLARTSTCGRGVFATRSIAAGELIFEETPVLVGPIASDQRASSHCVGCNVPVPLNSKPCSCSLPFCGRDCPEIEMHRRECERIASWHPRFDGTTVNLKVLQLLPAIRALCLDKNRLWLLEAMQANESASTKASVQLACADFTNISDELSFLQRTTAVLNTNAFEVATEHLSIKGLYAMAGQLNHNCVPNTRHSVGARDGYPMAVYASRKIKAGEQITTSYTRILWDTSTRRLHLFRTKQFWCNCDRCADPTELGTYLGALRCQTKDCSGRLLSSAPLVESSDWKCDQCQKSLPFGQVCQINSIAMGVLQKQKKECEGVPSVWSIAEEHTLLRRLVWPSNKLVVEFLVQNLWQSHKKGW